MFVYLPHVLLPFLIKTQAGLTTVAVGAHDVLKVRKVIIYIRKRLFCNFIQQEEKSPDYSHHVYAQIRKAMCCSTVVIYQ